MIDNTVMQKISMTIRVDAEELAKWKAYAKAVGLNLSQWIRDRCNGGPSESPVMEIAKKAYQEAKAIEAIEVAAPKRPVKECMHGVTKGHHCWQCRGLAVINAKD